MLTKPLVLWLRLTDLVAAKQAHAGIHDDLHRDAVAADSRAHNEGTRGTRPCTGRSLLHRRREALEPCRCRIPLALVG